MQANCTSRPSQWTWASQTLELQHDVVLKILHRSPKLALNLLHDMSARLRSSTEDAEELALLTVDERLIRQLYKLAEWSGTSVPGGTPDHRSGLSNGQRFKFAAFQGIPHENRKPWHVYCSSVGATVVVQQRGGPGTTLTAAARFAFSNPEVDP